MVAGEPVGPATDVFAWAAVMVFAGTGTPPFGNDSLPAVLRRILHDEPYLGDLPGPLRPIVLACLTKNPAARPGMQDVLLRLIGSRPAPYPGSHPVAPSAATLPPGHRRRQGKGMAVLTGVGALAVAGALVAGAITLMPPATTSAALAPPQTPKVTRTSTGGNVRVASVTLDGMKMGGCHHPSTFAVAKVAGPSGKQIPYQYRWIVDGQDEGKLTGFVTNGSDVLRRNPMSSFSAGKHSVVFRLLSGSGGGGSRSFTICEL
ncbi:hypothetical protein AB0I81_25570 [Nonomuraea sp. NPDC050404]|uniref:hypothetical protein n=1 Tax=Nonomuraea sp. NPDC050404 TaxID=3155783 RepID=UPI0033EFCA26